jgi:hypothetical protein
MNIYLSESDIITKFEIENNVLTICYGKLGKITDIVTGFQVVDKQPYGIVLFGENCDVNIFYKSLKNIFEDYSKLIDFLNANVIVRRINTKEVQKELVISEDNITDTDMENAFAELVKASGQKITF